MAFDLPKIQNPFKAQPKPTTIQDFSLTTQVLAKGREWTVQSSKAGFSVQGVTKFAGAHLVVPVTLVAAAAIDALVHLLAGAAKLVALPFKAVLFAVSLGRWNEPKAATPAEVAKHLAKVIGAVVTAVVTAPVSILSSNAAINFSNAIGATNVAAEKAPTTVKQVAKDIRNGAWALGYKIGHDLPLACVRFAKDHKKATVAAATAAVTTAATYAAVKYDLVTVPASVTNALTSVQNAWKSATDAAASTATAAKDLSHRSWCAATLGYGYSCPTVK